MPGKEIYCPMCDGSGDCQACDGTGLEMGVVGAGSCPTCAGGAVCDVCGGSGLDRDETEDCENAE